MSSHHFNHPYHHTEYAPPVLRAPSPASSVGTAYGPDQTSLSDSEHQISQTAFERKWLAKLDLDKPRKEEEEAMRNPLLARPESKEDEDAMVKMIMKNLRTKIQRLEEDELFEQTLLRGSQVGLEARPSANDIDALMKSMMDTGVSSTATKGPTNKTPGRVAADETLTDGPWNQQKMLYGDTAAGREEHALANITASTAGKRRSRKTK